MSFVQGASNVGGATNTLTVTFGAGVAAGNTVWGAVTADSSTVTISATIGGTAVTFLDTVVDGGNNETTRTFILGNISGAPTAVIFSFNQTLDVAAVAIEESGCLAAANPTDVHTGQLITGSGTGADALSSGSVTTTTANDIIVGACLDDSNGEAATAGTSPLVFTLRNTALLLSALPLVTEDDATQVSPGSVSATFGTTGSHTFSVFVIAIKPAVASSAAQASRSLFVCRQQ